MEQLITLVKRNTYIYLRDKAAVFFSLLSMLIVIILMIFFIADSNVQTITDMLGLLPFRDADKDKENAELLVLMWTCAGIISINAVTVTLSALSAMIRDKHSGRYNSLCTAPVSRSCIAAGYICSAWLCSVIICVITLVITELFCVYRGAGFFSASEHLKLMGLIAANSFTYSSLMYLIAALVRSEGAWNSLGVIIGTLVGFLGGIYMPIGTVSESVGDVMKCLPVIYGAAAFREIMAGGIAETTFEGAPAEMLDGFREVMGIDLNAFDIDFTPAMCVTVLLVCGAVFLAAGTAVTGIKQRSDR
ncbi:MAG: ABC transporter permease [Ruminococcus sp.]|nr:ABC transporter permease [Ruminococcus sp.]